MNSNPKSICESNEQLFRSVDDIVTRIHQFKIEPAFSNAVKERSGLNLNPDLPDEVILKKFVELIAYSNNAKANLVGPLIEKGILEKIFHHYDIPIVASLDANKVIKAHGSEISPIRFPNKKVVAMIDCAKRLQEIKHEHVSFMRYLQAHEIPPSIRTMNDFHDFWKGFDGLREDLKRRGMPYFRNFTSLCHLLMDLGYDCAKPDIAVMKAAVDLQIVPPPPKQEIEKERRKVIEFIQKYAMSRGIKANVVDLYFLIQGRQSGAKSLVLESYYEIVGKAA